VSITDAVFRAVRSGNALEETVERLLEGIKLGVYAPGDRLPAERELTRRLGVSRITLRDALHELGSAGYVETKRGRFGGTFVLRQPEPLSPQSVDQGFLEDALTFRAVIEAYRLPKGDGAEAALRGARIELAMAGAADVPRRTALAAAEVIGLAESVVPGANPNVVADAAAAAAAARAALKTALVNIEVNRGSISDPELGAALGEAMAEIERQCVRADELVAAVRARVAA